MISAFEITGIILLAIGVGLVIWWYMEAANYDTMLVGVPFAKGANKIYDPSPAADNTVKMSCPYGKQICVYQATQICTNPSPGSGHSGNHENQITDPIINLTTGSAENWSKFNPDTTYDLTALMNAQCSTGAGMSVGTPTCEYDWDPAQTPFPFGTCTGENSGIHLLAGYTCQDPNSESGKICNPTGSAS